MEAAGLRVEATVRSEPKIFVLNGPWLLGHGTVAQNPVCTGRVGARTNRRRRPASVRLPFAAPVRAPRSASEQLLDRLELDEQQPVADQGQTPHLPASLLHVVGLDDEVHRPPGGR
jgi:hypothetical protein